MTPRFPLAAAALLATALVVTGCSGAPEAAPTPTKTATAPPPSTAPVSTPTPRQTAASAAPTCETIVSDGTVTALTDIGWTAEERDLEIGDLTLKDGILCLWADYSVVSDHGQLYGWAPISAEDASEAQSWLLAQGWKREDGPAGSYFTENPEFALSTDDEGYGMTYLFGDGWVKVSDTKQGLVLVDWAG